MTDRDDFEQLFDEVFHLKNEEKVNLEETDSGKRDDSNELSLIEIRPVDDEETKLMTIDIDDHQRVYIE